MEALVGAGGWGYFSGGLESYARGFRFVEINVSFYRRIPEATARRWRSRVPEDFVFALKANQAITHAGRLRSSARTRTTFAHDLRIARILRSPFVILETPPGLRFEAAQVAGLRELAEMSEGGPRLGLEARSYRRGRLPEELRSAMEDGRVLDVVDLSRGRRGSRTTSSTHACSVPAPRTCTSLMTRNCEKSTECLGTLCGPRSPSMGCGCTRTRLGS